jgi:hypothetical protein
MIEFLAEMTEQIRNEKESSKTLQLHQLMREKKFPPERQLLKPLFTSIHESSSTEPTPINNT